MAFWGVEVKPGKPITHSCENARGRLRISQATLGIGEATSKTIVQCNVGKRSPVLLCALLPDKTESCHLDLEFEEPDDVLFSVLGPRSVYLTGYYVQKIRQFNPQSDTESYGLDIENTHTEGSSYGVDDEKYDDSFINDDAELQFSPRSPVNNEGMDDEKLENDKLKDKKDHGGQHRKKYCVIESDSDANTHEDEDEYDDKRAMETTTMSDDGEKDDSVYRIEPVQKVACLRTNGEVEGETELPLDEEKTEARNEKNELGTVEEIGVSNEKVLTGDIVHENSAIDTTNQMQSIDVAKPKKKRKQHSKKEDKDKDDDKRAMETTTMSDDGEKDDSVYRIEPIQKVDCLRTNGEVEGETELPLDEEKTEARNEKNELGTVEEIDVSNEKVLTGDTVYENSAIDTTSQMQSIDVAKPKKKRKQRSKKEDKDEDDDKRAMETTTMSDDGEKDDSVYRIEPIQKVDCLRTNGEVEGETELPLDEEKTEARNEKNESGTVEEIDVSNEKVLTGDIVHENSAIDTTNQMPSIDIAKPKKKRKQRSKKEDITCNIQTDNSNMDIHENSEDGQKSKKIRNELGMDGINTEGTIKNCQNVLKDDEKSEEGSQHVGNLTTLAEICTEEIGLESRDILKEDKYFQVLPHDDSVKEDLPAETGEYQDRLIDNIINTINKEILASDSQSKKKTRNKKKKKKKTQDEKDMDMGLTNISDTKETTPEKVALISKRILSNGLIIEELVHGPPDGKTAVPGKKVKIYYTAMLKETGHVFGSNVGNTAYLFQLGDEDIIDGWNVGIDGMRVGDKRRLVIPPSMGFGNQGIGDVPPNSWLVYEIELVSVRK